MEIGMVGLGRMGANMTLRLLRGGHTVVVTDINANAVADSEREGAVAAASLEDLCRKLRPPRAVWIMVPAGDPTETTITELVRFLEPGDIIIDGGNSNYRETMRRSVHVKERGKCLLDVGTSGGVWGIDAGYSLMVGGEAEAVENLRPVFETLAPAPDEGWGHVGPSGAGHFVKMIHNGIEYGMMQAFAEGFDLMKAKSEFGLNLHQVAEIWRHGSVVRSWLLDLAALALEADPNLSTLSPWVGDSGEGRWTVQESIDLDIPAPVIALSLMMRFASRQDDSFAGKMLAALREQFGGHAVRRV